MLSRWSRLKSEAKRSGEEVIPPQPLSGKAIDPWPKTAEGSVVDRQLPLAELPQDEMPPVELPPISELTKDSDYTPFMQAGVDPLQRNAAMRQLFKDPHYNIMDGLDIYIDDYSKPDPIPPEMLKRLVQSQLLNLFKSEDDPEDSPDPNLLDTEPRVNPVSEPVIPLENPKTP
jgi:Protein of unknown function (DUF3306)